MTIARKLGRHFFGERRSDVPFFCAMVSGSVNALEPLFVSLLGDPLPMEIRLWDGSAFGPPDSAVAVKVNTPLALRRILYAPHELGVSRAYVLGEIEVEGDLLTALRLLQAASPEIRIRPKAWAQAIAAARSLGVIGRPLPPPDVEARLQGLRHSLRRDAKAVSHHYDVSNDFYRLVLGESMTYSCARFIEPGRTLESAQEAKFELICRKLGLQPGQRLLDVGCGWGSMVMHAARHHGVRAVGITLSQQQRDLAAKRVAEAGLAAQVEIRLQDYRHVSRERFDAVSSIGMFEHVGHARRKEYFDVLASVLGPGGRLLNHAISTPNGASYDRKSFIARYVFPDGELQDVGETIVAMEHSGFEVRDVESLREHYALTLRHWVANLADHWDEAVALVGPARARVWRAYMTGAIISFENAEIAIHQVLGVIAGPDGASGMSLTRDQWEAPPPDRKRPARG